jgi:hypothetical protein
VGVQSERRLTFRGINVTYATTNRGPWKARGNPGWRNALRYDGRIVATHRQTQTQYLGDSTTFVVPWSVDPITLTPSGMTVAVDQQRHELSLQARALSLHPHIPCSVVLLSGFRLIKLLL